MKIYYDKSRNFHIVLTILVTIICDILLLLNDCPLLLLLYISIIPLVFLIWFVYYKRRLYIERKDDEIVFTTCYLEKYIEKTKKQNLLLTDIVKVKYEKSVLILITNEKEYRISNCYVKKSKLEEVLGPIDDC